MQGISEPPRELIEGIQLQKYGKRKIEGRTCKDGES
jgi:hypothetical protein